MISKGNSPTAEQQRFWSECAELGCVICGSTPEIDHLAGASARQNKVKIGNWLVATLCPYHHRLGKINRTLTESAFFRLHYPELSDNLRAGRFQLHRQMISAYVCKYGSMPYDKEVEQAINDYLGGWQCIANSE